MSVGVLSSIIATVQVNKRIRLRVPHAITRSVASWLKVNVYVHSIERYRGPHKTRASRVERASASPPVANEEGTSRLGGTGVGMWGDARREDEDENVVERAQLTMTERE